MQFLQSNLTSCIHKFIVCLLFILIYEAQENASVANNDLPSQKEIITHKRRLIKVLSIDGGGIRGIIPALILREIESKLKNKQHLSQCFDIMSETSTGGIIVLLLNTPGSDREPQYLTADIVSFYQNLDPKE
jgi:hypothetical protein